jgi:hypothetical protein
MLNNKYRDIKNYVVNTSNSGVENLTLFGIFKANKDYNDLSDEIVRMASFIPYEDIGLIFDLSKVVPNDDIDRVPIYLGIGIEDVFKSKLENMSSLNLIKDYEEIRNNIIKNLDKLNFITKNGYDIKLENGVSSNVILTSFTGSTFYSEYSSCIEYIKNNVSTMNEKLNQDIDEPVFSSEEQKSEFILNTLTPEDLPVIMTRIKENFEYDDELFNDIEKHIGKFLKTPKTYNLRYGKKPKRKNGNPIVYNIGTETVTTTTPEIKQIFAINNTNVTENLNYYKK